MSRRGSALALAAFVLFVVVGLAPACRRSASTPSTGDGGASQTLKVAVIPKGTTHEFWKSVHAGAVKAGRDLGVEIVWKGPLKEDDLKQQIDLVENFTAQGMSGIVLAPLNDKALVPSVKNATRAGIPVVIFDSDLQGSDHVSFVATDNLAAGRLAGERMGKLVGGKGGILLFRYQEGSASTHNREQGFLEGIRSFPEIRVLSDNQYGGATTESAYSASESLLLAQNAAKGAVAGIFCPNESTTFGMLLALEKSGLAGKIHFIGFDASEKLLQGVRAGHIDALVLQNPFRMGELAVRTMFGHLRGTTVERRIDTGARLVDADNLEQPEIRELLKPDLRRYLGEGS